MPEPWAGWLIEAGFQDARSRRPSPSARRLSEAIDVSTTTLMDMMYGESDTTPEVIEAVAEALKVDVRLVYRQTGRARTEQRPWKPPVEANLLTRRQQLALNELIRAIAEESGTRGDTSPMTRRPGVQVAQGVDVPDDDLAHRRRAAIADDIAAGRLPAAARAEDD